MQGRCVPRMSAGLVFASLVLTPAFGDAFENYRRIGQLAIPSGASQFDALPDGRIVYLEGSSVFIESASGSRQFALLGSLPGADIPSFGAAFLRASPSGQLLAIGNNGGVSGSNSRVGVFSLLGLTGQWFNAAHFDAGWRDNTLLAITSGDFVNPSVVSILDVTSPDPQNPDNRAVIDGITGASAGVAFDAAGNLFTGDGFTSGGPSDTGLVRAFPLAEWTAAYMTSTPLDFETEGAPIIDALSASPLGFDDEDNLLMAGGDFGESGETDYVGLVRGTALAAVVSGGGPLDRDDPSVLRRLDPDPGNSNFFTFAINAARGEFYVRDFGSDVVYVYLDVTGIPAASTWGLVCLALALSVAGTLGLSRVPLPCRQWSRGTLWSRGLNRAAGG